MFPKFDELKKVAFSRVLDTMGEAAVWQSSADGDVSGRILFKYPTKPMNIGDTDNYEYTPNTPTAEWYKDTFVGLKELNDAGSAEYLLIRDGRYFVSGVETNSDGDVYVAKLQLA